MVSRTTFSRRSILRTIAIAPAAAFTFNQPATAQPTPTTYYVDPNGNDNNTGTSTASPWQTLAKVNSVTFHAGESVLFKSGSTFVGQLVPHTDATPANPVIFAKYGSGNKPIIMGDGTGRRSMHSGYTESMIYIYNTANVEIQSLAITSTQADTSTYRTAVYIRNNNAGVLTHIAIKDCEIYGIRTKIDSDDGRFFGGIFVNQYSDNDTANFDQLVLDRNYIHDTDMAGIYTQAYDESRGAWDHPNSAKSTNVVVSNNTVSTIGGDGIVVNFTSQAIVEHNVVSNVTTHNVGAFAAIWTAVSDDIKIQYNEVYGTNLSEDGMAFDDDLYTNRSVFQYNYSHDNAGGFFQSMMSGRGYIVRYNVSQNDSTRIFRRPYVGKHYNNVIYLDSDHSTPITADNIDANSEFYNNIVYAVGSTSYPASGGIWNSNSFYGAHPASEPTDSAKIVADPQFVNAGGAGTGISTAAAYKLQSTSPLLNKAKDVGYNGTGALDFFGDAIPRGAHNLGADEYRAVGGPVVLVANPGFEVDLATPTPTGWSTYSGSGSTSASYTETNGGGHSGSYHLTHYSTSSTWNVYTFQTVTGLVNGAYTLTAWAMKSGNGFNACTLQAKNYGGSLLSASVPSSSTWQKVTISNVVVTNGQIELGFWTDVVNGSGNPFVYIDDVTLDSVVANPGFEVDLATPTPTGWSTYSGSGSTSASYTETNGGGHSGSYHLTHYSTSSTWNVYTFQTVTGLVNGAYTLTAWAMKSGNGFNACTLQAKNYGGSLLSASVPSSSTWQKVTISNVVVTNGQIELGFWTDVVNGSGNPFVYIDDVTLVAN